MDKTSYNHLAARLNNVQCFYNAATAENERLKTNIRAFKEAYAKASRRAKKAEKELVKVKAQLAAAVNQLEDGRSLLLEAVKWHRLPCNNGGIQDAR
jgi:predicted  nucleic acid-binding Zn-ribbon protein